MGVESKEEGARGKKGKDDNGIFRREGSGEGGEVMEREEEWLKGGGGKRED